MAGAGHDDVAEHLEGESPVSPWGPQRLHRGAVGQDELARALPLVKPAVRPPEHGCRFLGGVGRLQPQRGWCGGICWRGSNLLRCAAIGGKRKLRTCYTFRRESALNCSPESKPEVPHLGARNRRLRPAPVVNALRAVQNVHSQRLGSTKGFPGGCFIHGATSASALVTAVPRSWTSSRGCRAFIGIPAAAPGEATCPVTSGAHGGPVFFRRFTRCRRQAPTGGTPTHARRVARMTKRRAPTGAGKSASEREARH